MTGACMGTHSCPWTGPPASLAPFLYAEQPVGRPAAPPAHPRSETAPVPTPPSSPATMRDLLQARADRIRLQVRPAGAQLAPPLPPPALPPRHRRAPPPRELAGHRGQHVCPAGRLGAAGGLLLLCVPARRQRAGPLCLDALGHCGRHLRSGHPGPRAGQHRQVVAGRRVVRVAAMGSGHEPAASALACLHCPICPPPRGHSAPTHPTPNRCPTPTRPAVLLAAHVAVGGMLGAGLGAFDTSFWLNLSTRWVPTNDAAWMALPHLTSCRTVMHLGPMGGGSPE